MKGKNLLRGIRNLVLGGLLVFGVTALAHTDANAQGRFHHTRCHSIYGFY